MALTQAELDRLTGGAFVNKKKDIGVAQSVAAGLGSGIFKIFEGVTSFGGYLFL